MNPCTYENFDITIQGDSRPYLTTLAYRGQNAEGKFDQDITLPDWQKFDDHADRGQTHPAAKGVDIAAQGSDLFRALIHGDLRDLWVTAQSELDRGQVTGLRLRLILRPPAVSALPWEILRDPDRRRTLAANKRILLVRMETLQRYVGAPQPLAATLPLTLLLALPTDPTGQIDADAEEEGIRTGLAGLTADRIRLTVLRGRFDVLELGQALERQRPDLLHIVTHGTPDGLLLWQDNEPTLVSPDSLRTALEWTDSVKLVVLNACQTARAATAPPLASLGAYLLQTGLPGVIAMQFPIQDQAAIRFSRLLYTSLIQGECAGRVDVAVAQARSGLFALNNQDTGFGAPVLWLNAADGVIFNLPTQGRPGGKKIETAPPTAKESDLLTTADPIPGDQEMDTKALLVWIESLRQRPPSHFSGDLKLLATQQHDVLTDLHQNLSQLQGLYLRQQRGDLLSAPIRRLEETIVGQQDIVRRLETMIQANLG